MRSFIYGAEEDEASTIISLLSATGQEQKPFARRVYTHWTLSDCSFSSFYSSPRIASAYDFTQESVRLLGRVASSESPAQNAILQTANLNKALTYIKSRVMVLSLFLQLALPERESVVTQPAVLKSSWQAGRRRSH